MSTSNRQSLNAVVLRIGSYVHSQNTTYNFLCRDRDGTRIITLSVNLGYVVKGDVRDKLSLISAGDLVNFEVWVRNLGPDDTDIVEVTQVYAVTNLTLDAL